MHNLTIAGPTLAALLQSLLTNCSPCDGLLLGEHTPQATHSYLEHYIAAAVS
jgi:hypothetical protein